ncbi:hypothetical protein ABT389_35120 [Streptomyces bacillaris]|uniref:hypothetical protein n=1 Tax=Streptomyces bacillaris TaxID=68179 RepID=UPI00335ACFB7
MTELPHDTYMGMVRDELESAGVGPRQWWTEAGEDVLEAVFEFARDSVSGEAWPRGVYLGWDQDRGWALYEPGGGGLADESPLGRTVGDYAHPREVALICAHQLQHGTEPEPGLVGALPPWDGGDAVFEAVTSWTAQL